MVKEQVKVEELEGVRVVELRGDLDMDGSNVRFGNGIEFWGGAHDHLVEGNRIWEIYDSGDMLRQIQT